MLLREAVRRLDLKHAVKDHEIATMVSEAQDKVAGNTYQALNHQQRSAMTMPTVEWVIPELLPAIDATLVVGSPKVGKTRLAIALVRSILDQSVCLDRKPSQSASRHPISDDRCWRYRADVARCWHP